MSSFGFEDRTWQHKPRGHDDHWQSVRVISCLQSHIIVFKMVLILQESSVVQVQSVIRFLIVKGLS
jgi:hypothetical protein